MNLSDLQQIVTKQDLIEFEQRLKTTVMEAVKMTYVQLEEEEKPQGEFISSREFAKRVGVSRMTSTRWCVDGVIRASQPNGYRTGWLIPATEVDRMLEEASQLVPNPE